MTFAIFDENFYLDMNYDVKSAVLRGDFSSGLAHFQLFGLQEGRVNVSPIYSEEFYLENNPDVAAAVSSGFFPSGLAHFIQFGEAEGRTSISTAFNEEAYLFLYPDVAQAVAAGYFSSGLAHFFSHGRNENRPIPAFNEEFYLIQNPDVASAVAAGYFQSATQHYIQFGQFEGRTGLFSGTELIDKITGFGRITQITGFDTDITPNGNVGLIDEVRIFNQGFDTLTGGGGMDRFLMKPIFGNQDSRPLVKNFEPGKDMVVLPGKPYEFSNSFPDFPSSSSSQYDLFSLDGNLLITFTSITMEVGRTITQAGKVGIIEGVSSLQVIDSDPNDGFFIVT